MADPHHPNVEAAAAEVDATAVDAIEVVLVIATAVVPARQIVLEAESAGRTPDHGHAPGTDPAREANHPAAKNPDPAAPWIGPPTTKPHIISTGSQLQKLGSENDPAKTNAAKENM